MYKPTASFNLSKSTKRVLSTILNKEQRALYKNTMIQAELAEIYAPRSRPGRGENNKGDNNGG